VVSRFSSLIEEVSGKSPEREPAANKLVIKLNQLELENKKDSDPLSPFSLALKQQASSNKVTPLVEKPGLFLPNIASARQNAHLRDFKYTPENIEEYLSNTKGDKDIAKQQLMMDYSCSALP
jgi:hypothetical protein